MLDAVRSTQVLLLTLLLLSGCGGPEGPVNATPAGEPQLSAIQDPVTGGGFNSGAAGNGSTGGGTGTTGDDTATELSFTGRYVVGQVELNWNTTAIENLSAYKIRRALAPITDARGGTEIYRGRDTAYLDAAAPLADAVHYRLFIELRDGQVIASDAAAIRTLTTIDDSAPTAVANVTTAIREDYLDLRWLNPADTDLRTITLYRETSAFTDVATLMPLATIEAPTDFYSDRSVTSGTDYVYGFVATDALGQTSPLTTVSVTFVDQLAPEPPRQLEALVNEDSVQLTWLAPNSDDVSQYMVARHPNHFPGYTEALADDTSYILTTNLFHNDLGLSQRDYYYSVFALDAQDNASTAATLLAHPMPVIRPNTPTGFATQAGAGEGEIYLTWDDASSYADSLILVTSALGYRNTPVTVDGEQRFDLAANMTTLNFTASSANEVFFSLFAVKNGVASAIPAKLRATPTDTIPPPGATVFTANATEVGVELNWTVPNDSDLTDVIIQWSTTAPPATSNDGQRLSKISAATTSLNHYGTQADTTYYYSLFTTDLAENINAAWALNASATTLLSAGLETLANVQATPGDGRVQLNWQPLQNTGLSVYYHVSTDPNYLALNPGATPGILPASQSQLALTGLANGAQQNIWLATYDPASSAQSGYIFLQVTPRDDLPPVQIQNAQAEGFEDSVLLRWDESNLTDASFIRIRMSTSQAPANSGQGTKIYDHAPGRLTSFSVEGLETNENYYFSFFTTDNNGNDSLPISVYARTVDRIPPTAPSNVTIRPGEGEISLYWDLPANTDDVAQTKLVRSETPIVTSADGVAIELPASVRFYSDTTVVDDVPYYYGVYFIDSSGNESLPAFVVGQATDYTAPTPITNLLAFADDQRVDLQWQLPTDADFAKTVVGYTLGDLPAFSVDALVAANEILAPGNSTSFTGLTNDQRYTFSAFALDDNGNYENLATVSAIPVTTDPAPAALSFTVNAGENEILLSWSNPTTNIDDTVIQRSTVSLADALASGVLVSGSPFTTVTNSYLDSGLINGQSYYYVLINRNENGNSAELNATATPQDATPPESITGLQVVQQDQQITFTWNDPTPAENDLQDIIIRRRADEFPTNETDGIGLAGSPVAAGVQTVTDSGLVNGQIYYYAFFARDTSGFISSRVTTGASPIDTTAPASVSAASLVSGNAQVTLGWTNPPDPDLDRIVIRKSTSAYPLTFQDGQSVASLDAGGGSIPTTYTDVGLINLTDYYYSVFALDANNNASAATTLLGQPVDNDPPPTVSLSTVDELDQRIDFVWNNPANADFNRVKVLRRGDVYPANAFDPLADLIYEGTSTSVSDTFALINGNDYFYRFYSLDVFDNASFIEVTATPQDLTPPGSITGLVVTPADQQVTFSWINPLDPDVAAISIRRRLDDFPTSPLDGVAVSGGDLPAGTSNIVDNDVSLTNDTTYYYSFFVRDNAGLISNRVTTTATPIDTSPPAPVSAVSVINGEGQITLNWTNPADPDLQKIVVRRSKTAFPADEFSDFSAASLDDGGGSIPQTYTDINLDDGDTYYYSLFAVDANGNASSAVQINAYPVDVTAPVSVFNINATALDQRVDLTWSLPPDPDFDRVRILRRDDVYPTDANDVAATTVYEGSNTSYSDVTALTNDTTYFYRFFSLDVFDNASSADISAMPVDLTPPSLVSCATCVAGDEQVSLSWNNPPETDTALIHIRRSTTSYPTTLSSGVAVATLSIPTSSYVDSGLTNLQNYYYAIFSEDADGNVSAGYNVPIMQPQDTIAPAAVSGLTVTDTNLQIGLSWTNPGDDTVNVHIRRAVGGFPVNATDGTAVAIIAIAGATDSHTDSAVSAGTTYSYSLFSEDEVGNFSLAAQISATPVDLTPPANVTAASVIGGDYETTVSWTNPVDADFSQVRIYRRVNAIPTQSGTYLITTLTGGETSYNDTGLSAYTNYYYLVVAGDTSNNLASGVSVSTYTDYATISDATLSFTMEKDNSNYFCWVPTSHSHFNRVEIRSQATTPPATTSDGTLIFTGTVNSASEQCYEDLSATNGNTSGYTIFSVEDDGEYTTGTGFTLTPLASGELEYIGPIDFAGASTGEAVALKYQSGRYLVAANNSAVTPQVNLTRIDMDGQHISNIGNGSTPTLYALADISLYSTYWYGAGRANTSNDDLATWRFYYTATTFYSSSTYDTGAFNDHDRATNMLTYSGYYFASGYREVSSNPYPVVWSLDSGGYVRAAFNSGSWTIPTANAQGQVVDHIQTSDGRHLFAIESTLGDSLVSVNLSSTGGSLNSGFDSDGELSLPDDEVTALSRAYATELSVSFPIYVSTVTAGGDVKIYAVDADGTANATFGAGITLNEANPIRIDSMRKEPDNTLHAIGTIDNGGGDRDIMYWRIAADGTVEVSKQFTDGTMGTAGFNDQWPAEILLDIYTYQPMFIATGVDASSNYEILFGRISND